MLNQTYPPCVSECAVLSNDNATRKKKKRKRNLEKEKNVIDTHAQFIGNHLYVVYTRRLLSCCTRDIQPRHGTQNKKTKAHRNLKKGCATILCKLARQFRFA